MATGNQPADIPQDLSFRTKWRTLFADNTFQNITESTFREFSDDIDRTFARVLALNSNLIRGANPYRIPHRDALATIPARMLILEMEALAVNGVSAAEHEQGLTAPGVYFRLVRNSSSPLKAYLDPQENTTAKVGASWVLASGSNDDKTTSYPLFSKTAPYEKGDLFQYTYPTGQTRLFEVKSPLAGINNPDPEENEANDTWYKHFAPPLLNSIEHDQNTDLGTNSDTFEIGMSELVDAAGDYYRGLLLNKSEGEGKGFLGARVQNAQGQPVFELVQCREFVTGSPDNVFEPLGSGGTRMLGQYGPILTNTFLEKNGDPLPDATLEWKAGDVVNQENALYQVVADFTQTFTDYDNGEFYPPNRPDKWLCVYEAPPINGNGVSGLALIGSFPEQQLSLARSGGSALNIPTSELPNFDYLEFSDFALVNAVRQPYTFQKGVTYYDTVVKQYYKCLITHTTSTAYPNGAPNWRQLNLSSIQRATEIANSTLAQMNVLPGAGSNSYFLKNSALAANVTGNNSRVFGFDSIASGLFSMALGRRGIASAAHALVTGFSNVAGTNGSTATGCITACLPHPSYGADGTRGQYSGGTGPGLNKEDPAARPVTSQGYAAFNHSTNTGAQELGHGALADHSAILGGVDGNLQLENTGVVLTASQTTKLPINTKPDGSGEPVQWLHASPQFLMTKPGGAFWLLSPNGTFVPLRANNDGTVNLVAGTGSGENGAASIPLSGTTANAPVTGNVVFSEDFGLEFQGADEVSVKMVNSANTFSVLMEEAGGVSRAFGLNSQGFTLTTNAHTGYLSISSNDKLLYNGEPLATAAAPAAPASVSFSNATRGLLVTLNPRRTLTAHEYTLDAGQSWQMLTSNPFLISPTFSGDVQTVGVRVAADYGQPASATTWAPAIAVRSLAAGLTASFYAGYTAYNPRRLNGSSPGLVRVDNYGLRYESEQFDGITSVANDKEFFTLCLEGYINIPQTGNYRFFGRADDSVFFYLDEAAAARWPGAETATVTHREMSSEDVYLTAGYHLMLCIFGERQGGENFLVDYESNELGMGRQDIPISAFFHAV